MGKIVSATFKNLKTEEFDTDQTLYEISEKLEYDVKPIISQYVKQHEVLYNAFYDAFSEFTSGSTKDVHFVGKNNFLKQPEFNSIDKVKICKENNIDFFVDDSPRHCLEVSKKLNIPVIGFKSYINKDEMLKNNIKCVSSWKELYNIIKNI